LTVLFFRYTIPGEDGNTSEGHRQLNWVWYQVCLENSQEYVDVMTDIDGHRHRTTLPPGKIDPRNWEKQKALALTTLPKPFAEMVQKTQKPFISAINDRDLAQPSFFDGKLLLVGDSLATFRPHVAPSTNQAALNALLLERLMKGEIDAAEWEAQACAFAEFTTVRSQLWSAYYMSGVLTLTFGTTFARYWKTFIAQAVWNCLYR
jgi:2-polyprenyl-6-methoxyphenol hydroxylase-like FAD-dependent oxidoreductase